MPRWRQGPEQDDGHSVAMGPFVRQVRQGRCAPQLGECIRGRRRRAGPGTESCLILADFQHAGQAGVRNPLPPRLGTASKVVGPRNQGICCIWRCRA